MYLLIYRIFCEELAKCKGNPSEVGRVFKKRVRCLLTSLTCPFKSGRILYLFSYSIIYSVFKEHELDRYITFCDGKGDSESFLESQPKDFFEVGLQILQ